MAENELQAPNSSSENPTPTPTPSPVLTTPTPTPTPTPITPATPTPSAPTPSPTQGPSVPDVASSQNQPQTGSSTTKPKTKKLKLIIIIIVALLVLIGASAGAYFALIVPNQPGNVFKAAIKNSATQKKSKFAGKLSYESTDPDAEVKAVNVTFSGQSDMEKNAFQLESELSAMGAKIPLDIKSIDKSLFFKIGDLSSVKSLAGLAGPEAETIVDDLNKKIANQWIEVDETLLKESGLNCSLNSSYTLTDEDFDLLLKRYNEVPFATSKNSNDTVDGKSTIKYEIEIDDNKGAEYVKGLDQLSIVKKMKECNPNNSMNKDDLSKSLADGDKSPLIIWVSKADKQIVKIATHSTAQDEQKEKFKATFEMTFQYGQAEISKPEGAKPFIEILGDFGPLLGGQPTDDFTDFPVIDGEMTQ